MEGNSGGGPLGGVGVSLGNGSGGQNIQQILHQAPHWAGQQQQFFNDFQPGQQQQGGQSLHHQQMLQQQQMMQLAAAQAGGNGPGQQGPPGSGQQGPMLAPTLNMMLQGMQAAAAAQGLQHTLQSPPNSGGGFLLLPGMGHPHQGQQGRDISPNSTPSLSGHPPPSATPPNLADLSDRNWATQAAQHNLLFGGHRMMNHHHPDKLDDITHQIALAAAVTGNMNDLFHGEPFNNLGQHSRQQQQEQLSLNQLQLSDLALSRGLNPYQYVPATSPPHMFQQQIPPHQMPPRPRPEGGQDPSPNFINEQSDAKLQIQPRKKDDLIIGSWSEEEVEKPVQQSQQQSQPQQQQAPQQHMYPPSFMMQQRPPVMEEKETTGWGAPPPPNTTAAGGWGAASHGPPNAPPPHPTQHPPPNQGMGPRKPNWQPTNLFDAPPPVPQGSGYRGRGGHRGGNGTGEQRPRYNEYEPQTSLDGTNQTTVIRGGGAPRGGRGGYRGNRGGAGPRLTVDHTKEKDDGKKSAIAETIAMMNKMKMEDKERKDAARQREEKKRALNPESDASATFSPDEDEEPHPDEPAPPRRHGFRERGTFEHRGRGTGRGARGNRSRGGPNVGPGSFPLGAGPGPINPTGGLFMSPPDMGLGGGIPPFPGLENFIGGPPTTFPGSYPTGPTNPFYPMPQNQFNPGFRFPRGAGNRGQIQFGFPGPRGPFMPPMMPRQSGPMILPRGQMGGRGRGGNRGGRGGRGGGYFSGKENDRSNQEKDDDGDRGQAEGGESDDVNQSNKAGDDGTNSEPAKNALSEQGTMKGQLALFANSESHSKANETKNLRERLIQQLVYGRSECMVCLDKVKPQQATWNCKQCYQIFHIYCIKKWSKIAVSENGGWRCPGCQCVTKISPNYRCFCGKVLEPPYNRNETPHSCGEVCELDKKSQNPDCTHKCTELCHPGPCPPCTASTVRICPCGKTKQTVKCGSPVLCQEICEKILECSIHTCKSICHEDECPPCDVTFQQTCFCSREQKREVICGEIPKEDKTSEGYSCKEKCSKKLECGNHDCQNLCHPGECSKCEGDLSLVSTCPCKKKTLEALNCERKSCLDKIPSCGAVCGRKLTCGPNGRNHTCREICHTGPCPSCPLKTKVLCRCGAMDKELDCALLKSRSDDAICQKKCAKKRTCGKHKCGQKCCIDQDHICMVICGKTLSCGLHRCSEPCHFGNCPVCPNVSFEELTCFCGTQVLYPPIPCGTKPPSCSEPCRRRHPCEHDVRHNCHSDEHCPPCTALTEKWCHGKHELRKNVPCHLDGIFCGRDCGVSLPCKRHTCIKPCHLGECLNLAKQEKCTQKCQEVRPVCGHPCNAVCHDGNCPNTSCLEKVKVSCACGHLTSKIICSENESENSKLRTSMLAAKMSDLKHGSATIDLNDIWATSASKNGTIKKRTLECNEECAQLERNRRLALALQIENPELSNKLGPPKYSEFLKEFAKKDLTFAQNVHDKLADLVKLAKDTKHKTRSFSFDCMNREKRQFIHEYSDFFGVTTESFDAEPKRNVVATAAKDKSWLPSQSIVDAVQNLRKAPGPVKLDAKNGAISTGLTTLQALPKTKSTKEEPKKPDQPDYFD